VRGPKPLNPKPLDLQALNLKALGLMPEQPAGRPWYGKPVSERTINISSNRYSFLTLTMGFRPQRRK
jgi:hypothetical protein